MAVVREGHQHPGSYVDPAGTVYMADDQVLRGIRHEFSGFYSALLDKPAIQRMLGQEMVDTAVAPIELNGYALTLQHRRLSPVSYCYEWSPSMLREAALLTLDICLRLVDDELTLKDATPWNIVFEGPRPIFIDFTSIMPQEEHLIWGAYDQFCRFFLFPLILASFGLGKVLRALMLDHINGIADDEMARLLPPFAWRRMPWLIGRTHLPRLLLRLVRRLGKEKELFKVSDRLSPHPNARRSFFSSLQKNILAIPLGHRHSRWSRYYADLENFLVPSTFNIKQEMVVHLLEECKPETVTDIGCNRGGYSILAAQSGARVSAFDVDEECVSLLYGFAKERQLAVLPLVIDVLNPSPSCGWRASESAAAPERLQSEMAVALALVHHLCITQVQTFERVLPALADYARRWLLTEFVPLDDPRCRELMSSHRRDMSWYSLENFVAEAKKIFKNVATYPSHPAGRTLILCAR